MAKRPSISAERLSLGDILARVLIEKPLAAVSRATGASERDAAVYGSRVARNVDTLTGIVSGARSTEAIARGNGTAQDAVGALSLFAPAVAGKLARPVARGLFGSRSAEAPVVNSLYHPNPFKPSPYASNATSLPQYAFRNISSPNELAEIARSGAMLPRNPGGQKYFTMYDNPMGNPANLGAGKPVVRVDSRYIPHNSPVSSRHVEVWDAGTRQFRKIAR